MSRVDVTPDRTRKRLQGEALCVHLAPVVRHYRERGARVERTIEGAWRGVGIDHFVYREGLERLFSLPYFVVWEPADLKNGYGNSVKCEVCETFIEGEYGWPWPNP